MPEIDLSILSKLRPATPKKTPRKSLAGKKFTRWTVYSLMGYDKHDAGHWLCRCDCGTWRIIPAQKLRNGRSMSCGCYKDEATGNRSRTHGMSKTLVYRRWSDMLSRVNNPTIESAKHYSGRGITACSGLRVFETFHALLGEPPHRKWDLDRKDNDGNYSCGSCEECLSKNWPMNVRWVPKKTNIRNRRVTRWITIGTQTKCMAEWLESSSVKQSVAWRRLNRGWTPEDAFEFTKNT